MYWTSIITIQSSSLILILVNNLIHHIYSIPVFFEDCGNGEIKSMDIEPCHSLPCHFEKGQRANVTLIYQPKKRSNYLHFRTTLRRGGLLDYPITVEDSDPHICESSYSKSSNDNWGKIKCPVVPGKTYTIKMSRIFPISTTWNVYRYSKIKIFNEYGEMVGCSDWYLDFNRYSIGDD